jgi:uncharacterized protein with PQ loop repeat
MTEFLGWASSMVLLATLVRQVYKAWKERSAEGISKWFFAGQVLSSIGFTTYSYLVGNWVFTVTNALILVNNILGVAIYFYFRNRGQSSSRGAGSR